MELKNLLYLKKNRNCGLEKKLDNKAALRYAKK
jgi:hypothetical protein